MALHGLYQADHAEKETLSFQKQHPAPHYAFERQFNMEFPKRINAGTNVGSQQMYRILTMSDIKRNLCSLECLVQSLLSLHLSDASLQGNDFTCH